MNDFHVAEVIMFGEKMERTGQMILFLLSIWEFAVFAPSTVTMEDSASFLLTSHFMGVAHPPGYPLYTLLGKTFSTFSFFQPAYRIHLLNAILGSMGIVLYYNITILLTKRSLASFLSAILLSCSYSYWFQSITAEVYILNTFFSLLLILLGLQMEDQFSKKRWFLFCFVYGLSLSNHWPLMILSSLGFVPLFRKHRIQIFRILPFSLLFVLLGTLPYMHLYISQYYTDFFFYGKLDSISLVWEHIIRKEQWEMDELQTASFLQTLKFLQSFLLFPISEFSFFYIFLVYPGIFLAYKRIPANRFYAFLLFLLSTPLLLLFSFRTEFNQFTEELFRYWLLLPYCIGSIFATFSIVVFAEKIEAIFWKFKKIYILNLQIHLFQISTFLFFLIVLISELLQNYPRNDLRKDTFASDYAKLILNALPQNAVLITNTDSDLGGQIGFVHFVEGIRPDIKIVSQAGALFPNGFFNRKDENDIKRKQILFLNFYSRHKDSGIRVFSTREITAFNSQFVFPLKYAEFGLFKEIIYPEENPSFIEPSTLNLALSFANHVQEDKYKHQWNYYRNFSIQSVCHYLLLNHFEHPVMNSNRWCKLIKAQFLNVRDKDFSQADKLFLEIIQDPLDDLYLFEKISIHRQFLLNRYHWFKSGTESAQNGMRLLQDAADLVFPVVSELPFCNNQLATNLKELHYANFIKIDIDYLNQKFKPCPQK